MLNFQNTELAFKLRSDEELKSARFLFSSISNPRLVRFGSKWALWALRMGLPVNGLIRRTVFRQFCGGESIRSCTAVIERMHDRGVQSILDYSAEGKYGEEDLDRTHSIILRTIEYAREHPGVPLAVFKPSGLGPSAIWTAVSAGQTLNAEQEKQWARAKERIRSLCAAAEQANIPLMFDAEESWMQKAMDDLCLEMMRTFNQERPIVFNTLQMYRHDRLEYLKEIDSISARDGFHIGLKIVRGAYMEKERQRARERGIPSPIQPDKAATDRDYNEACAFIADRLDRYALVAGSHNEESAQLLADLLTSNGQKDSERVYFSQLYGMSDHISFNLAAAGFQVVKYLPFGPIQEVMPYLIRRAEENTSVGGQSGRELQLISEELRRRKG